MMKDVGLYGDPVLTVIADEMMYWRKNGVFPSQKRILNEVKEKFGISRCIRTLNRWLAVTESNGLIRRKKRHKKDKLLGWIFRSSLYTITGDGWKLLIKAGKYTWDQFSTLIKEAKANFRKSKKPRMVLRPSGELTHIGDILEGHLDNTS